MQESFDFVRRVVSATKTDIPVYPYPSVLLLSDGISPVLQTDDSSPIILAGSSA